MKPRHIIMTVMAVTALSGIAQRRITPVKREPDKTSTTDSVKTRPESVVEVPDIHGNIVLVDTISGHEYTDTILTTAPKLIYPKWESASIGVNAWDPVMRCFGQKYGLISFWGEISIHNWIKPYVEVGFGSASDTPEKNNYTYKSGIAPFLKIGANYNFLYNSNPAYSVYLGLRYGITNFSYSVEDVNVYQGYWGDDITMDLPSQRITAGYLEVGVGLKVMIATHVYLGWEVKAHAILHRGKATYGNPWYIPGYGTDGSLFSGSFSVSYTLPFHGFRKRSRVARPIITNIDVPEMSAETAETGED